MCEHADTLSVVFDDRRPIVAHLQCADCRTFWKTWGPEYCETASREEVRAWFVARGMKDPGP